MHKNQMITEKVALITGAARRVGAEIARTLHEAGMNVVLHYHHSKAEASALCDSLNAIRINSAITVCADLSEIASFPELINQVIQVWGRLDVLVHNASRFYRTKLGETTELEWDQLIASNVKGPYFLTQAALPYLSKSRGCIVTIADIHGERPMKDYGVYCLSKAGLIMLTKSLAKELGPSVRVNAVSPGAILWPEGENTMTDEEKESILRRTSLKRAGGSDDIAKAVLFFVNASDYVTGQVLAVDGGRSLMI